MNWISDLDLVLFGRQEWIDLFAHHLEVLSDHSFVFHLEFSRVHCALFHKLAKWSCLIQPNKMELLLKILGLSYFLVSLKISIDPILFFIDPIDNNLIFLTLRNGDLLGLI